MKKEIADLWVKALRSGKYEQCKHQLRYEGRFCCLGVLTELSGEEYDPEWGYLPLEVADWAGMKSDMGLLRDGKSLIYWNDQGKTFPEIANIIEKHWEEL